MKVKKIPVVLRSAAWEINWMASYYLPACEVVLLPEALNTVKPKEKYNEVGNRPATNRHTAPALPAAATYLDHVIREQAAILDWLFLP